MLHFKLVCMNEHAKQILGERVERTRKILFKLAPALGMTVSELLEGIE